MIRAALACVLCALCLVADANAADTELGRLFFTPAQRAVLDAGKSIGSSQRKSAAPRNRGKVFLNGVVRRSDGEATVWINGKPTYQESTSGMKVKPSRDDAASAQIGLPGQRIPLELRVGQEFDRATGRIAEAPAVAEPAGASTAGSRRGQTQSAPARATADHPAGVSRPVRSGRRAPDDANDD